MYLGFFSYVIILQFEGWDSFDERRRLKVQKQLDSRAGNSAAFDEGADKSWEATGLPHNYVMLHLDIKGKFLEAGLFQCIIPFHNFHRLFVLP